jgi:tRNA nucleotidyltransferase (CCA-adding enzyme)
MKIYLVGGAVRDSLLGLAPGDRDWVVVGAPPEEMLALGYKPVGRDFPVFLHPQSGEEYALARTERKSGRGYRGFAVNADVSVTLEEDLLRRDFTINAIAREPDGALIDPFGGARDVHDRVLRHVGPAFVEDPLRVLRAARFLAKFAALGFRLADETLDLMREIAASGELDALTPERVWQELRKALCSPRPSAFFAALRQAGALRAVLPEVDALYGVPQRAEFHPEVDTGLHQQMVSDMAARIAPGDDLIGFAALCHDLGKALTPAEVLPRHIGHEQAGVTPVRALCERLKTPAEHRELAVIACREHLHVHRLAELRNGKVYELLARCDAFRKPGRIAQLATVCEADKRGRLGNENTDYPQGRELTRLLDAALTVSARDLAAQKLDGAALGAALKRARIAAIAAARRIFV